MSFDKREAILQRMLAILQTVAPASGDVLTVFRNRGEIPVEKMPALVLLDGRETIAVSAATHGGILVPTVFTLQPQVFLVLRPTVDNNNDGIGEAISAYRMKLLKAFSSDEELIGMIGANGEVEYLGHITDMETSGLMLGQVQFNFTLTYVLNPKDY